MLHKMLAKSVYIFCCICLLHTETQAQTEPGITDTLHLDIVQAEKRFLNENLALLAQHYNIQSNQALVEQAKKWDNPNLNTDQNVYSNNHFFQHTVDAAGNPQGEVYVQVQQLIKTAGKRGKQMDLAKTNVNIAEWQFKSVMRNLRATLFKDFYTVAQLQGNAQLYKEQKQQLDKLLNGMAAELKAGNIAKKEYLRVQALLVSLQQDMTDNANNLSDNEAELKTILHVTGNTYVQPDVPDSEIAAMPDQSLLQLVDSAKQHNTDYQQELYQLQYQQRNLRLQKALAVPDVSVGPEFDQAANYSPNYVGLSISLPLPVWNRNQGNIKSAKFQIKQEEATMQLTEQKLQNDVTNSYQKLLYAVQLNSTSNTQFYKDYYQLYQNIVSSYNNRQISLIEFLDYFNDYSDTRQKQLNQTLNLRLAKENLNDIVGVDVAQ